MAELERIYKDTDTGGWGWVTQEATGGGGGSTAGAARVLGPFPFDFDTPGINDGVAFYTPAVGDLLIDCWIQVDTAFDGTTPQVDVGTFVAQNTGLFFYNVGAVSVATADAEFGGAGVKTGLTLTDLAANAAWYAASVSVQVSGAGPALELTADPTSNTGRTLPALFTAANPLKVVLSQTGAKGGAAVGGSTGVAAVYLVVATPSLT